MRTLILEEWISLDGYAADRRGATDFFPSTEANRASDEDQLAFLRRVDTMLIGRKTYEAFAGFWPTVSPELEIIAEALNSLDKVVLSNTLTEAPWGDWKPAEVVGGDAVAAVRRLKARPGKAIVLWGSISLAQTLMAADLIDEYHIQVCPVLVGGGRPLFADRESYATLRRVATRTYDTGVVFTQYEPVR